MEALVVAVRWGGAAGASASLVAAAVRAVVERARGVELVGVAHDGASFSFEADALEEAIELALALCPPRAEGVIADASFRIGIGLGELEAIGSAETNGLSVGAAAARAYALARTATAGEILVDVTAVEREGAALLVVGRRMAVDGGRRFRGVSLDLHEPWRRDRSSAIGHVREPRLVGRESVLNIVMAIEPGGVAVVRAAPGLGGTRLLEEIAARTMRALVVAPHGTGAEPLGAIRTALARAAASGTAPNLGARELELQRALATANGIDVDGASDLLTAWLGDTDRAEGADRPMLVIDDATHVDHASLEAIGLAASSAGAPFAVVARIDAAEPLPAPLTPLVVEAEVTLKPLMPHEAAAALADACGGERAIAADAKKRWLRRAGGSPLGIVESLRHGLAVGDLAVGQLEDGDAVVTTRTRASGRGRNLAPSGWIARRLATLAIDRPSDALLLSLIAITGAGIERSIIDEATNDLELPTGMELEASIDQLRREGLVISRATTTSSVLSASSRTLAEIAVDRCDEAARRRLHSALAGAFARAGHGLDLAEGAHHAALAGDHLGAASLAVRASDRARRAGLHRAADALSALARAEGGETQAFATAPSPPPRPRAKTPSPNEAMEAPIPSAPKPAAPPRPSSPPRATVAVPVASPVMQLKVSLSEPELPRPSPLPDRSSLSMPRLKDDVVEGDHHETIDPAHLEPIDEASDPPHDEASADGLIELEPASEDGARAALLPSVPLRPSVHPPPRPLPPRPRAAPTSIVPPPSVRTVGGAMVGGGDEGRFTLPTPPPVAPGSTPPPPSVSHDFKPLANVGALANGPPASSPDATTKEPISLGVPALRTENIEALPRPSQGPGPISDEEALDEGRPTIPHSIPRSFRRFGDSDGSFLRTPAAITLPSSLLAYESADSTVRTQPPRIREIHRDGVSDAAEARDGLRRDSDPAEIDLDFDDATDGMSGPPSVATDEPPTSRDAPAREVRRTLLAGETRALEAALVELELAGGSRAALLRLRSLLAISRGDPATALRLARRACSEAASVDDIARAGLAYAIVLAQTGRREHAIRQALTVLGAVRRSGGHPVADAAARLLLMRLLDGPVPT